MNELKLNAILDLNPKICQVVDFKTRPKSTANWIHDPIITTLASCYRKPVSLPPLKSDNGLTELYHLIVFMEPLISKNYKRATKYRYVKIRRCPESAIQKIKNCLKSESWSFIFNEISAHRQAELLQNYLLEKINIYFPEKLVKFSHEDREFMTPELKILDRKRKRIYSKEGKSEKWVSLNNSFKMKVSLAKQKYYNRMIKDLKISKPHQWYSKLKRMTSYDQHLQDEIIVDEICQFSPKEQAEILACKFSSVSNQYDELQDNDIVLPHASTDSIPVFTPAKVYPYISTINTNKSNIPGDIPAKFIKMLALYISIPFSHILNSMFRRGEYPTLWKHEVQTPIPKSYPPKEVSQLRNISGLLNLDKIAEKILGEMIISDTKSNIDMAQYGNQAKTSIQHYLVNMLHEILSNLDKSNQSNKVAVILAMIDWKEAFPRQCPILGVKSFMKMGVRPAILPILVNFFQGRTMQVKWKGILSEIKKLKGGGPMGSTIGLLEYLMQSNNNSEGLTAEEKYKFIDDLSILEVINILTIGIASYLTKFHVPNDISVENGFISSENLRTQATINEISEWTKQNKMVLNQKKSNIMLFNQTQKYQFQTRISMNGETLPIVDSAKLLGTVISSDLSWDKNTADIVKRANPRLQLLLKASEYTSDLKDLKQIYITYIRSVLEQSAVVWHSSLTVENISDLERVQKNALRIILKDGYSSYNEALDKLRLEDLNIRRFNLCKKFAGNCVTNVRTKKHFKLNSKSHSMSTRKGAKYNVDFAHTEKFKKSTIPYLQRLLNEEEHT